MIINERKLFGVLPYTTVFFPSQVAMADIAGRLKVNQLARFFWSSVMLEPRELVVQHEPTATVCVDLRNTPEELWNGVTKNGRNEIRGAERLGDRVQVVRNGMSAHQDFFGIYDSFARAKSAVSPLTTHSLQRYGDNVDIFVAYLDGRPLCAHVNLMDTTIGRVRMLYSASRRLEHQQLSRLCGNLNRLLHWREMTAYREDGFTTYDFGGIRQDPEDGIARFKTSFGGEICQEHTYLCAGSPWIGAVARTVRQNLRRLRLRPKGEGKSQSSKPNQQDCDAA